MSYGTKVGLLCLVGIIVGGFVAYTVGWFMAPGSYPRAERYEFDMPEEALIQIIKEVKRESPQLDPDQYPAASRLGLQDGRVDKHDHWYSIYFYDPERDEIIHTWTRSKNRQTTTFGFAGINKELRPGAWQWVNDSFWWWENTAEVERFEKRILSRIKNKASVQNDM
ncbi:hypothetical protein AB9P05_21715 [Roseivirga sp. BDSF3-8]|uniref:hypothetical protein n=1 Tax=Roseivirga sp. BDSF3-8 TaxID=3241598 RepID=UPI0035321E8F